MEKLKVVIDCNSWMGSVDLSDANLTSYCSTRKRLKKYYQKHCHHLIDICCKNSYLLYKKKGWQHLQDRISSETYRKFNFKISYNRRERPLGTPQKTVPPTRMNAPHYPSYITASVKAQCVLALRHMLQKASTS
jgi:hypothetical protein